MTILSTPVNPTDVATAAEYNNLRTDLLTHTHDGVETPAAGGMLAENLLANPGFELWTAGPGPFSTSGLTGPDRWVLSIGGTSTLAVARDGPNADQSGGSQYAAALSFTLGSAACNVFQAPDAWQSLKGTTVTLSVRVKCGTPNAVRIYVADNVNGQRFSAFHTGSGQYETLTVTAPIAAAATNASVGVNLAASCIAQADNATLVLGSAAGQYAPMAPAAEYQRAAWQAGVGPPNQVNQLANPGFELWAAGTSFSSTTLPLTCADRWTAAAGAGATLGVGRDSANADLATGSQYCASVSYTHAGTSSNIFQNLDGYQSLRGASVALGVRVRSATAGAVRIYVWDSVNGFRYSAYHSGSGQYETLTVACPIAAAATGVQVGINLAASCTAYVDSATLTVGTTPAPYAPAVPAIDAVIAGWQAGIGASSVLNLLTNPGFEVWQRGVGPFSGASVYTADRWLTVLASSTLSVARDSANADVGSNYCAACTYTHVGSGRLVQNVEDYLQLRGRMVAFRVRVKTSVVGAQAYVWDSVNGFRFSDYHSGSGQYETLVMVAPIGAAATGVQVGVSFGATMTAYIDSATLVLGLSPMPYTPLHAADDLARCLRYYQEIGGLDVNEYAAMMQCFSTTTALGVLRYAVEMALAPTITVSAAADWAVLTSAATITALTVLSSIQVTRRSCRLSATVGSAVLVAGNATALLANTTAAARIKLEANP